MFERLRSVRSRKWLVGLLWMGLAPVGAQAQFWEKKSWQEWSKKECETLLSDSPWAKTFTTTDVRLTAGGIRSGATQEREVRPTIEYIAQLRSALPIRQAVVRLMQLQTDYAKMNPSEKAAFDKQAREYLEQDFSNRVVVHIVYQSNVRILQQGLDDTWRTSATDLPAETYLIGPRGDRVDLARFIPPSPSAPEFELIFPKVPKDEPIVNKTDKKFQVQLPVFNKTNAPSQNQLPGQIAYSSTAFAETRVLFEFAVPKMMYGGKLEY